jgi:predicted Fe-S protein YdhL (DUF1289 family)
MTKVQSPCISQCCLDINDMCVGCFRMLDEILIWGQASPAQQQTILDACVGRKRHQSDPDSGI